MAIGPSVRRLFGSRERWISDAYRRCFVSLADWTRQILAWSPNATTILEVGCGEGAMTEQLSGAYPEARIVAIDITPRLGRLYSGNLEHVTFRQVPVETIALEQPRSFDLVVLSDVIHHVPEQHRISLLAAIRVCLATHGDFLFKDWIRTKSPIHWACAASDRFLTGDDVSYLNGAEMHALIHEVFGSGAVRDSARVRPWRNNLALLVSRSH